MAGMQWLCMLGKASEIRLWFLDVGHTKTALDALFGAIKLLLRRHRRVMTMDELNAALQCSTASPTELDFVFDWRVKCKELGVKGMPNLKNMHYFSITKAGMRCSMELDDDVLTTIQNMLPGVKTLPVSTIPRASPVPPLPNRSKGLRHAFQHMNMEEKAFWVSAGYTAVVPRPKKCVTHAKNKKAKAKAARGGSSPSSQVPEASQSSQVPLSQVSAVDHENAEHTYEYESDDDDFLCFVCGTHAEPLGHERLEFGAGERWGECQLCERWFHYGCSRLRNMTFTDYLRDPYCDQCQAIRAAKP